MLPSSLLLDIQWRPSGSSKNRLFGLKRREATRTPIPPNNPSATKQINKATYNLEVEFKPSHGKKLVGWVHKVLKPQYETIE